MYPPSVVSLTCGRDLAATMEHPTPQATNTGVDISTSQSSVLASVSFKKRGTDHTFNKKEEFPPSLQTDRPAGTFTKKTNRRSLSLSLISPTRFVVKKDEERSETKVNEGPDGFDFNKGEKYTFKYSFKPREGMRVSKK